MCRQFLNKVVGGSDDDYGIYMYGGAGWIIEQNEIYFSSENGIYLSYADNNTIRGNTIVRSGTESSSESSIYIYESDNTMVVDNEIYYSTYDGIRVESSSGNTFRDNFVRGSGHAGIKIYDGSGHVVDSNKIEDGHAEGIVNVGSNTVITDNDLKDNRLDICNEGTIATFNGNDFDTGGSTTTCITY